VGGRGSLVGGILGAWVINGAKSWLTAALPSAWLYVLGVLFVVVTLFVPDGLIASRGRQGALVGASVMTEMVAPAFPAIRSTRNRATIETRLAKRKLMLWVDDVTVDFDGSSRSVT